MRLINRTILLNATIPAGANKTLLSGLISRPCTVRHARVGFALGAAGTVSVRLMKVGSTDAPTLVPPIGEDLMTAETRDTAITGDAETRTISLGRYIATGAWYLAAYCINSDGNEHRVYVEVDIEMETEEK